MTRLLDGASDTRRFSSSWRRLASGHELSDVFGEMALRLGVNLFFESSWASVGEWIVAKGQPHSALSNLSSSVRGTSNLPRSARHALSLPR